MRKSRIVGGAEAFLAKHRFAKLLLTATVTLQATHAGLSRAGEFDPGVKPRVFDPVHVTGAQTEGLVRIVDGTLTTDYPSVGALLYGDDGRLTTSCTGTIINCDAFLTAAHCIASDSDTTHYKVFLQHGGVFDVRALDWPKSDYRPPTRETGSLADIAIVRLEKPVDGIVPQRINDDREQARGAASTIVGFGRTTGNDRNAGLKRYGGVLASVCPDNFPNSELVCWRYVPTEGSNTCGGDSGGPLLLSQNRLKPVVSGVTSAGIDPGCGKFDRAFDTSVFKNSTWVKTAAGIGASQPQCGLLLPLDTDVDGRYLHFNGQINALVPQHVFKVSVQSVKQVRVSANLAKPIGAADKNFVETPELYVISGDSQDLNNVLCQSQARAQAVSCEKPLTADIHTITIILRGDGPARIADFQLVVSVY